MMSRLTTILACLLLLPLLLLAPSCDPEAREANINQEKYIDDYISKAFADYEVIRQDGVSRVVIADSLLNAQVIEPGDSVYILYKGYTFASGGPSSMFVEDEGVYRIGAGDLIKGLDRGLPGSHLGSEVLLLFPSQLGYDKQAVGLVPENTALMFDVLVAAIKKNQ